MPVPRSLARCVALFIAVAMPDAVHAQGATANAPTDAPAVLFQAMNGKWGCTGGFSNGRPLAADLTFTTVRDGRALRFTHVDRAPSSYWQEATWAFDEKTHRVYSLSVSGSSTDRNTSAALFSANNWTAQDITLKADSLNGPPWAPNRFSYSVNATSGLTMRWEVQRNGAWALGDSLICSRTP